MPETNQRWNEKNTVALEYIWAVCRVWAATARQQRTELFAWRSRVLLLTIIGAVLGTFSQMLADYISRNSSWTVISGILGGILVVRETMLNRGLSNAP